MLSVAEVDTHISSKANWAVDVNHMTWAETKYKHTCIYIYIYIYIYISMCERYILLYIYHDINIYTHTIYGNAVNFKC